MFPTWPPRQRSTHSDTPVLCRPIATTVSGAQLPSAGSSLGEGGVAWLSPLPACPDSPALPRHGGSTGPRPSYPARFPPALPDHVSSLTQPGQPQGASHVFASGQRAAQEHATNACCIPFASPASQSPAGDSVSTCSMNEWSLKIQPALPAVFSANNQRERREGGREEGQSSLTEAQSKAVDSKGHGPTGACLVRVPAASPPPRAQGPHPLAVPRTGK